MRVLTLLSLLLLPVVASAGDVPRRMTWHGRLARADGTPETNPQELKFSLYTVSSGGSSVWTETLQNVPVSNGYYAVVLGAATPLPLSALNGQELYLGLALNGGAEQQPRVRVASVPYALKASDANTLDGHPTADFALTAHSHADVTGSASGFMSSADKSKLDGLDGAAYAPLVHTHAAATSSADGFMSAADKAKLGTLNAASYAPVNHTHPLPTLTCTYRRATDNGNQAASAMCNSGEVLTGGGCALDTSLVQAFGAGVSTTTSGTGTQGFTCNGNGSPGDSVQAWAICCKLQ